MLQLGSKGRALPVGVFCAAYEEVSGVPLGVDFNKADFFMLAKEALLAAGALPGKDELETFIKGAEPYVSPTKVVLGDVTSVNGDWGWFEFTPIDEGEEGAEVFREPWPLVINLFSYTPRLLAGEHLLYFPDATITGDRGLPRDGNKFVTLLSLNVHLQKEKPDHLTSWLLRDLAAFSGGLISDLVAFLETRLTRGRPDVILEALDLPHRRYQEPFFHLQESANEGEGVATYQGKRLGSPSAMSGSSPLPRHSRG